MKKHKVTTHLFYIAFILSFSLACGIFSEFSKPVPGSTAYPAPSETSESRIPAETHVVRGDVNIRSCPSTACGVVGWLYAGQHVEVSGCLGNWCEVVVEEQEYYIYAPCVGQGKGVCK